MKIIFSDYSLYLENLININNYKEKSRNYQISNHLEATPICFLVIIFAALSMSVNYS